MPDIYFDNNATTPIAPEVRAAMAPYLEERFGNPASGHRFGEAALAGLELAREQSAALLGCQPARIVFNSGATEGNNTAIFSALWAARDKRHIVSSQVERPLPFSPPRATRSSCSRWTGPAAWTWPP
jgi:cysteine desulfurase